ncbi:hypothetical protein NUU61_003570 [Penicillium alfredii]|uniref:Uncharacterized protein n=1 Tax=Penicillium alfredii TaxID=1506179 RepID=A0A9W9FJG1_9EURO|nr:uncharacterized protein NUU61_003570 [Penicillium alfredii]KAJ5101348.1 hypothetical protein NUU61_003570 [Penicillium alfredii]
MSSAPAGPGNRQVGLGLYIPPIKEGTDLEPPSLWADHIFELRWKVARQRGYIKSPILDTLMSEEKQREPFLRHNKGWPAKRLDEMIDSNKCNVESAMLQVVGDIARAPCASCQRGNGPWAQCVKYNGPRVSSVPVPTAIGRGKTTDAPFMLRSPRPRGTNAIPPVLTDSFA